MSARSARPVPERRPVAPGAGGPPVRRAAVAGAGRHNSRHLKLSRQPALRLDRDAEHHPRAGQEFNSSRSTQLAGRVILAAVLRVGRRSNGFRR